MSQREAVPPATHTHLRAPDSARFATAAGVFALMADQTRLHLLWQLSRGEADVGSLAQESGASRTAVSQHLAKLRLAGLVEARREGRHSVYVLRDGHLRRLIAEALNLADHRVTGEAPHD